jgi:signal transduction histidine kinase
MLGLLSAAERVAGQLYLGRPAEWGTVLANSLADWWSCGVFTPAFVWLVRRFPIRSLTWRTAAVAHLVGSVGFVLCKVALYTPILRWLNPGLDRSMLDVLTFGFYGDFLGYWAAIGVLHAIEYSREAREREVQAAALDGALRAGELQILRAQLQPHFLFNTLQAISTLIHRDPAAADRMLTDLSDLLRTSLTSAAMQEVTLEDDLAFLRRYLDIMGVRFGDRLEVTLDVPDDLLPAVVPSLALQPLVENAIRHGMANRTDVGHVVIGARRKDGRLVLSVKDDGPGPPAAPVTDGVGLANTRERLRRLYGADGAVEIEAGPARGTTATLTLPLRVRGRS